MLDGLIDAGSRTLAWRAEAGVVVDLVAFEAAADRALAGDPAALHEAARLYKGDVLPDCSGEWIDSERERLRQRARQVVARLIELLEHEQAFEEAIDYVQQSLRLDPLDEHASCALMRCHAHRGERATALHLYQQCAALLKKKELGIQPSAATRVTYREILDLDAEAPVSPALPRTLVYPLVGRSTEWQALLNAWHAASASRPRLFLIRGEAGIGESRLAEELVGWVGPRRINAVTARCYASSRKPAIWRRRYSSARSMSSGGVISFAFSLTSGGTSVTTGSARSPMPESVRRAGDSSIDESRREWSCCSQVGWTK